MATPRSNSACTLGAQEVGKTTLPNFSSCWPIAPLASAAVIRPAVNSVRPDFVFIVSPLWLAGATLQRLLHPARTAPSIPVAPDFDCARVSSEGLTMRTNASVQAAIQLDVRLPNGAQRSRQLPKHQRRAMSNCALPRSETLVKLKQRDQKGQAILPFSS